MADFTKALIEDSSIENLMEDLLMVDLTEVMKSVDGARDGEIGWRNQSKIVRGFDKRFDMEDFMKMEDFIVFICDTFIGDKIV